MKFLFIGQGYPGVPGTGMGSGIGMYLYELTQGLAEKGHECHVVVWANKKPAAVLPWKRIEPAKIINNYSIEKVKNDRIEIHIVQHGYYHLLERFFPDKYDEELLAIVVLYLEQQYCFDVIEIEHEEGIAIKSQKLFPEKTILRVHTTLAQMVETKDVKILPLVKYHLDREKESIKTAHFITVPSSLHAQQIKDVFNTSAVIEVIPNGRFKINQIKKCYENTRQVPVFLFVGSADRRKGLDLFRGIMDRYAEKYGPCELRIISRCSEEKKKEWRLIPPFPAGCKITWKENLSEEELESEYINASVLLHPARYESFGLSLIEAAARETPVVCTCVGIAPDLLRGELEKFIVKTNDPDEWADRLHEAYEKRKEIGRILRERYEENYTREKITETFLDRISNY